MVNLKLLKQFATHYKVLYVEDDLEILEEMAHYMSKLFAKVVKAKDGVEGLASYKKEEFDIVITDLSMPNMNGIEMLEQIRSLNKEQAILITTAHTASAYMISAIKIGVDGYVLKPFNYEQLNYELFKIVQKLHNAAKNEEYKNHLKEMVEDKTKKLNAIINFQKYNYDKTLLSMVNIIEERDTYTAGHSQRVAHYSKIIAKEMGYKEEECQRVYQAGVLHDIGKIATPDVVLLNPQKLNSLEYKLIQEHVAVGYRLLKNIPMFEDLADIIYDHHEKYNGTGYPKAIKDIDINPMAKIMSVADSFDAMTTNRIYKGRKNIDEAIQEIVNLKGIDFNPEVVDAAQRVLKTITIDSDIDQLPRTDVEKERFSYFYNDMLTNTYNQNYLDVILVQNDFDLRFQTLYLFQLKRFSQFNQKNGWKRGDEILKKIAKILQNCYKNAKTFRVFGDDFVLLDNAQCDISKAKTAIETLLKGTQLSCEIKQINLRETKVQNISELEKISTVI